MSVYIYMLKKLHSLHVCIGSFIIIIYLFCNVILIIAHAMMNILEAINMSHSCLNI